MNIFNYYDSSFVNYILVWDRQTDRQTEGVQCVISSNKGKAVVKGTNEKWTKLQK